MLIILQGFTPYILYTYFQMDIGDNGHLGAHVPKNVILLPIQPAKDLVMHTHGVVETTVKVIPQKPSNACSLAVQVNWLC